MDTIQKFGLIESFVFDMDGVLTDGRLYISHSEDYARTSHMRDGYAINRAIKMGYKIIIISGAHSESYKLRLNALGVEYVFMSISDKLQCLTSLYDRGVCEKNSVLYMGDDVPDLEPMKASFFRTCPQDACDDIKMVAEYISPITGGNGCVRDVIEKVLRSRGDWL